jgi:predicted ABC-type ATPase
MSSIGAQLLADAMRDVGIPVTLENYISLNWPDGVPEGVDPWEDLPEELMAVNDAARDLDDPDFNDPEENEEDEDYLQFWRDGQFHRDYDPNEPRVPAGSATGGQWTKGGTTNPMVKQSHPQGTHDVPKGGATGDRGGGFTDEEIDAMPPQEIARRMANAETYIHSIPQTDSIHTPEREALRKQVEETIYNHRLADRKHDREATIVLGLPGSGKTTLVKPMLDSGSALEIEGDNAKALIPEFGDGSGAWAVHEEASQIMRKVLARAVENGDNIFWPRIDSVEKIARDIAMLKKAGYTVHMKLVATEPEEAAKSAVRRFLKTGRYVSPKMIMDYGTLSRDTFEEGKRTGMLASAEMYRRGAGHQGGFERIG